MDLRNYLYIARRWIWLIILLAAIGAGAGYILASRETPVYQSSTRLLYSRAADTSMNNYYYTSDQEIMQTYMSLLTTQPVIEATSELLGYPVSAGMISSQVVRDTLMIRVTVTNNDPKHAADIANTIIHVLIQHNENLQTNRYSSSEESLKAQLKQVEEQIATQQETIAQVSEESFNTQKTQIESQIKKLEKDILKVQNEINVISPPPVYDSLGRVINRVALSAEENSLLQEKQLRLGQLQSSLEFYQSTYLKLVGASQFSATSDSSNSARLDQMNNTLALYQQIYANLLSSYEEVRLARMRTTPSIVQVETAFPPTSPIRPKPLNTAGIGGALGLLAALGFIVVKEYLDDTIKTPSDVDKMFGLPVIGYVAEMDLNRGAAEIIYTHDNPRSPVAEAFRNLRTNIDFAARGSELCTILVTSVNPGEGKTTTAVNLAITFAHSGKKVVIIDADMRRPKVHKYFGFHNRIGLSDIFLKQRSVQEVARPWKDTSLQVITSGSLPPNPSELLTSEQMVSTLAEAAALYDIVVLDSPPFLVTDAAILAARADGTILVIQPGHTHGDAVKAILEQLSRVGARIMGVVFNRIPRPRSYYYGGYRHYKGYYYQSSGSSGSYYSEEHPRSSAKRKSILRPANNGHAPIENKVSSETPAKDYPGEN